MATPVDVGAVIQFAERLGFKLCPWQIDALRQWATPDVDTLGGHRGAWRVEYMRYGRHEHVDFHCELDARVFIAWGESLSLSGGPVFDRNSAHYGRRTDP